MGREIRRVPAGWQHPRDKDGVIRPLLLDNSFDADAAAWYAREEEWNNGRIEARRQVELDAGRAVAFSEYAGPPPAFSDYMPEWQDAAAQHYMVYTLEGFPLSPVISSIADLRLWLITEGDTPEAADYLLTAGWDCVTSDRLPPVLRVVDVAASVCLKPLAW